MGHKLGKMVIEMNKIKLVIFTMMIFSLSADDFVKEIRSMFQEKSPIDYSIIKPFKKYSLKEFWNMIEALK